jgi:hypothetical protein
VVRPGTPYPEGSRYLFGLVVFDRKRLHALQQLGQPQPECLRERGQAAQAWLRLARLEKLQRGEASRTSLKFSQTLPIMNPREKPLSRIRPCPHARESRGVFCAALSWSKCGPKVGCKPHKGTIHGFDCGPITGVVLPRTLRLQPILGGMVGAFLFALTFILAPCPSPSSTVSPPTACAKQFRTFADLAEKLNMDVTDLMRQCNGMAPPSKALVKGLARELDINESFLEKLADEVRKDLGVMTGMESTRPPGYLGELIGPSAPSPTFRSWPPVDAALARMFQVCFANCFVKPSWLDIRGCNVRCAVNPSRPGSPIQARQFLRARSLPLLPPRGFLS